MWVEIADRSAKKVIDLIVIESLGKEVFERVFLGSYIEKVPYNTTKPLLIARLKIENNKIYSMVIDGFFKRVLYLTDFSKNVHL